MAYFPKRYHAPGTAPGTLVEHPDAGAQPPRVSFIVYDPFNLDEQADGTIADSRARIGADSVVWVHVQGHPDTATLQDFADHFDLHPLALEDVANTGQRPKLEYYDRHVFLILNLPLCDDSHTRVEQVSLFLGEGYVISIHAGDMDLFEPVRKRLRGQGNRIRNRRADYLAYALIDRVIDQGFPVLERFGERLQNLEIELLDKPDRKTLGRIHQTKRDLLLLRRVFWPQREVVNLLLREEHGLIQDETRLYLRDCYDHGIQIMDLLESYRDMSASMMDVYLSSVSNRLNDIMRVLTVISTIFMPLTFLVGVYGMNFGQKDPRSPWAMPELDWYYGYPLLWLAMVGIAVAMAVYFKRRHWF